jgi:hypothetical protein
VEGGSTGYRGGSTHGRLIDKALSGREQPHAMWGTRTVDVVGTVFPSSRPRLNAGHRLPLAGGARRRAEYSAESAVENVVKLAESYDDALVVQHKMS